LEESVSKMNKRTNKGNNQQRTKNLLRNLEWAAGYGRKSGKRWGEKGEGFVNS